MHAGNIFAALMSWLIVKSQGGSIVLRIEDLDVERSKPCYVDQVQRDFELLGLTWDEGPYFQQGRNEAYAAAFERLADVAEVYPCFCTRADLHAASAPHRGEKLVYAGTCRGLSREEVAQRMAQRAPSWRVTVPEQEYAFVDLVQGAFAQNLARECGDFVVRRSDGLFAYQLAVVVDDAEQGVNCIVRGMDLLVSTPQQMFLQDVLGLGRAQYAHVPLIVGERDRRLSKRDRDAGIEELLARFKTPEAVIGHIAALAGIIERDEPCSCADLLREFRIPVFPDNVQIPWQ
ncbi:MAG: tRNA glutamyl-Q(34) synthetase GluQRS [Eggerthellaceae bacterium]|nr:tRNA glutamyl-Q(34) synthetase GluQRS [Eggerthellaceae bacterium]